MSSSLLPTQLAQKQDAHRRQVELVRASLLCCPPAMKAAHGQAQAGGRRA